MPPAAAAVAAEASLILYLHLQSEWQVFVSYLIMLFCVCRGMGAYAARALRSPQQQQLQLLGACVSAALQSS